MTPVAISMHQDFLRSALGAPRRHVLLAESDPDLQSIIVAQLILDGYEVTTCPDGGALLDLLRTIALEQSPWDLPDLIVSDVSLPCRTGVEALELMRKQDWTTPVILLAAFPDEITRSHARRYDAWVIDKPFDVSVLSAAVFEALSRRESTSEPCYGYTPFSWKWAAS